MRIRHIRDKLVLASLVLVVPFIIWNVSVQILQFHERRDGAIAEARMSARRVALGYSAVACNVLCLERSVGLAFREGSMPRRDAAACMREITAGAPVVEHLAIADASGRVLASDMEQMAGYDVSASPSARRVMGGEGWAAMEVFTPRAIGKPVFGFVQAIRDRNGRLQGMVVALTSEKAVRDALRHDALGAEQVVIIDPDGVVVMADGVAALRPEQRRWSNLPCVCRALAGERVVVDRFEMADGRVMMGALEPIPEIGWAAGVFRPREEVMGPLYCQTLGRTFMVVLLTGFVIGMALYIGNRLAEPVLDLARTARRFGEGDLSERARVRTGDEVQFLGTRFNEMAACLQERTARLNKAVESERRQVGRASALYAVAQGLVVAMRLDARLEVIARALASLCGVRRCVVFLLRGNRLIGSAGWGIQDPDAIRNVTIEVSDRARQSLDAMITGQPIIVPDRASDPYLSPELAELWSVKGYLALPLVRTRHIMGFAILDNPGEYPSFDEETIVAAQGLASVAAIAIENAEVFEKWQSVAQAFQRALLPEVCAGYGPFRIACRYYAAMGVSELGGDFYDLIQLPENRLGLVIADVSGKGLEAAVLTAAGRYTLRAFVTENADPGSALTRANSALTRLGSEWGFVTMSYGRLDLESGRLECAVAGHPPPILTCASGELVELSHADRQPPLGIFGDMEYGTQVLSMAEGDVLVCYTDGVIEARRDGEQFEVERLASLVRDCRHLRPEEIAEAIHREVLDFSMGRLQDDIALLVVKREWV